MGRLVQAYKRMQDGGDPNRPTMQRSTTAVKRNLPINTLMPSGYKIPEVQVKGYKDEQTNAFFERLKSLQPDNDDIAGNIDKIRNQYGKPNVMMYGSAALRSKGEYIKPIHYTSLDNTIHLNDTNMDDNSDEARAMRAKNLANSFLKEVPHAAQWNQSPFGSTYKWITNDLPDLIKGSNSGDSMAIFNKAYTQHRDMTPQEKDAFNKAVDGELGPYQDKNAIEYDAHSVIEPKIEKQYKDLQQPQMANGGFMNTAPNKRKPLFSSTIKMKRMDDGGDAAIAPNPWQQTNMWATNNQKGITAVGDYGSATVNAFAPTDAYGVRSNGAALGSGVLSGAGKGAAIGSVLGPEGTLIGAGAGAVVGGVEGLLGNKKANTLKTQAIQRSTTSQLQNDQQAANARIAGDPSLKYGRMAASYYRFGGVMKNTPAALPRTSKPLPAVQPAQRLMPNITESPNRQMSRMGDGGFTGAPMGQFGGLPNAIRNNATKLFRPTHTLKTQKNQILATGGTIHKQGHPKPHFMSKNAAPAQATAPQVPSAGQPQQQMDPNQIAQMQQMMQQQGGMQQKANGGSLSKWHKKTDGGQVEQLSSQDALVNGPSHENGGVKFPSAGVELEGGETVNNGFVFSKKLGFAKPAATIARQLGKAEQRPENPINTATVNALQRKTELLKVQQEAAKKAAGIPSDLPEMAAGGPIDPGSAPKLTLPSTGINFAKLSPDDYMTKNAAWLGTANGQTGIPNMPGATVTNLKASSDKAMGNTNDYYPARNQQRGKDVLTIHSNTYKFGGKMKKMDDGGLPGNPWTSKPVIDAVNAYSPGGIQIPQVNITASPILKGKAGTSIPAVDPNSLYSPIGSTPTVNNFPAVTGQSATTPASPSKFDAIGDKISPFLSNYVNATQKLPLPPVPQLNTEITPSLVDYSASRNEAVRSARSADASARLNLNSGAAVSATKAANLAGQTRAVSQINEAENNQNSAIRNSAAAENAQIRASNTALQNNYQNELVQRNIKSQALKSANMANLEEKVQGMSRDKKMFDQEGEKTILGFLQNNDSGAGYDAARPILQKHLSPDQLDQMDTWASKMRADRASERADNVKANKLQLDYLKNNKSTTGVLNGASAVTSGKLKRNGTETDTDKEGNRTVKRTTALYN